MNNQLFSLSGDIQKYPRVLTNFNKDDLELYQQAILHDEGLFIQIHAHDVLGRIIENCYSLWTKTEKDRSNFWKCFRKLREQKESELEFWMILPKEFEKEFSNLKQTQ